MRRKRGEARGERQEARGKRQEARGEDSHERGTTGDSQFKDTKGVHGDRPFKGEQ